MAGSTGPLAQLLIDNAHIIDAAVEEYGASAVSEFFIHTGTGIAMAYGLHEESAAPAPAGIEPKE